MRNVSSAHTCAALHVHAQPAGKGSFLLHTWTQQALTVRANGFSPTSEAIGDGAIRMKSLAGDLQQLTAQAKILGLCERGSLSFDALDEPHKSNAKRLSKTKLRAALSAMRAIERAAASPMRGAIAASSSAASSPVPDTRASRRRAN